MEREIQALSKELNKLESLFYRAQCVHCDVMLNYMTVRFESIQKRAWLFEGLTTSSGTGVRELKELKLALAVFGLYLFV